MRVAQYKILKTILEKIEVPDYICAFEKNRSIPMMAALHTNKCVVVSLDLKDFFGSIKQHHLLQVFQHLGFGVKPALTLSELCTYKSFVPQGALTSPKLSNIVTSLTFGPLIKAHCDQHGYTLSIYADDIIISCDQKLNGEEGRDTIQSLLEVVTSSITRYGFKLNPKKIKVMNNYQRQYVCGTVTNRKVNLQKSERLKLRAIVHNCEKNGIEVEASKNGMTASEFSAKIGGKIGWFAQLNSEAGNAMKERFKAVNLPEIVVTPVVEAENVVTPETAPW